MKIPCEDCITKPICRNRHLNTLVKKCYLIDNYIESYSKRYKEGEGMRIIAVKALKEVNRVFKWGCYDNTM